MRKDNKEISVEDLIQPFIEVVNSQDSGIKIRAPLPIDIKAESTNPFKVIKKNRSRLVRMASAENLAVAEIVDLFSDKTNITPDNVNTINDKHKLYLE